MKRLSVYLLCACLVSSPAWGAGKKKADVAKAKIEAEEDICYIYKDYLDTQDALQRRSGGGFRSNSPTFRLMRERDRKREYLVTLQKRYEDRFSSEFDPLKNPRLCLPNVMVIGGN